MKNTATAKWQGDLKNGNGEVKLTTANLTANYTFASRFENGKGTNPEELVAAAHAACFSMALSNIIAQKGYKPEEVSTSATAILSNPGNGFLITAMELTTEAKVGGIDQKTFLELANEAKANCPISKTLSSVNITLKANLK
ncbi:MAG TPA: OsmC family protein [Bacteroidales bacterium]|nr:OsmC family protein [Bacteroidales bacterium]